jgi:hypothetical protein
MVEGEYHDDAQAGDDPAVAFDRLRGEVALLRRAVADMAAARTSIEIPNYQPTLERTEKVLGLWRSRWTACARVRPCRSPRKRWGIV